MTILEISLITVSTLSMAYYLFALYCTILFFSKKSGIDDTYQPPVSLLKPINGIEEGMYENFISYCKQDYPVCQIIFGVKDRNDPAIDVVKKVKETFPQKDIELVICSDQIGINPKISNLNNMYKKAKYDIIVTNDSDTRVNNNYLKKVVSPFCNENTGLVTCIYRENSLPTFTSLMESLSINHEFLPSIMVAQKIENLSYAFGVSIAIRRHTLKSIGGFKELADYLAEDFHLGKKVFESGYNLLLSDYIVDVMPEKRGFADFFSHQLRWSRTIKACRPTGYFFSSFFKYGAVSSLMYLVLSFCHHTGANSGQALSVILFSAFLGVRIISASIICRKYTKDRKTMLFLLPVSDMLSFVIWCTSFLGNKTTWRGKKFLLKEGGKIEPAEMVVNKHPDEFSGAWEVK